MNNHNFTARAKRRAIGNRKRRKEDRTSFCDSRAGRIPRLVKGKWSTA